MIRLKAFTTPVTSPPFVYTFPLLEAITTGATVFFTIIVGAWAGDGGSAAAALIAAAPTTAAALDITNSRRSTRLDMRLSSVDSDAPILPSPAGRHNADSGRRSGPGVDAGPHPPVR